eukprot:13916914-Alexandrium_andersonii.AAC.1
METAQLKAGDDRKMRRGPVSGSSEGSTCCCAAVYLHASRTTSVFRERASDAVGVWMFLANPRARLL